MAKATDKQLDYAKHIATTLGIEMPRTTDRFVVGAFIAKNKEQAAVKQAEDNKIIYEQIKREIPIVDVAKEMGYTVLRKGRFYTLAEHDSVRINPDTNLYIRNSEPDNMGSVIDFMKNFSNMDEREVIVSLARRLDGFPEGILFEGSTGRSYSIAEEKKFELPQSGPNMRNVYAYLTQSRYIEPDIVQYFVDRKMLYQDIRKNCVFVSYRDNVPVFASVKGTNTFSPFQGDVSASDYGQCWFLQNGASKLYVTEAPIDTMSRMSMFLKTGIDLQSYDYLAMSGAAKYESVIKHTKENGYTEIVVGTDNDEGGRKSLAAIKKGIEEENIAVKILPDMPKFTKDWNEELKYLWMKGYRYEQYIAPNTVELSVLNQELKALAEGNTALYKELQERMTIGNPEELRQYMFDYLEKNYEKAMEDISEGGQRSIREILKNYNKQLPIQEINKMQIMEKGIDL